MHTVGHAILVICYHVLDKQISYEEHGGNYFDERDRQAAEKRLVRRLEKLDYHVALQATSQVAWVLLAPFIFRGDAQRDNKKQAKGQME